MLAAELVVGQGLSRELQLVVQRNYHLVAQPSEPESELALLVG